MKMYTLGFVERMLQVLLHKLAGWYVWHTHTKYWVNGVDKYVKIDNIFKILKNFRYEKKNITENLFIFNYITIFTT